MIDQIDLDRAAAEALLARGVAAVVNVSPSTSGRYPNLGPALVVAAGVPLVDSVGGAVFGQVRDGEPVRLFEGVLYDREGAVLAEGQELTQQAVASAHQAARAGLGVQLEAFAADTAEFLRRDPDLLDGPDAPALHVSLVGRHALVVTATPDTAAQLKALRGYRKDRHPALIAVDGGAAVLAEAGLRPDVVVLTDADDADPELLRRAGEIVVKVDPNADPWALWQVQDLGLQAKVFRTAVSAADAAVLLAAEARADVVVTVGVASDLVGLLDGGRGRLASSFLTGLRAGARVVDARVAVLLYTARIKLVTVALLLVAGVAAVAAAVTISPAEPVYAHWFSTHWHQIVQLVSGHPTHRGR